MPRQKSGMTWFEDEEWIGLTGSFDQPGSSTWTLVQKIREREIWSSENSWKEYQEPSEARGIFVCEEEGSAHRQAVVKIYMQIPYCGTISEPRKVRAMQARTEMEYRAEEEIAALQGLTEAKCSSTPSLLAWKNTIQDEKRYVPGGYITYILMEKCPGTNLQYFFHLPRDESDQVRAAFKKAWHYLIDWEDWFEPTVKDHRWTDHWYLFWGLAASRQDDSSDTSTWEL